MHGQNQRLTPIKKEDFRADFIGNKSVEHLQPLEYFGPLIQQFKKLAAAPSFWFIADTAKGIIHSAGGMLEKTTPIRLHEMLNVKPDILLDNCHPDDITQFFAFTDYWMSYFMTLSPERKIQVRPTIYIRMKNNTHQFSWVMIQYIDHILDLEGRIAFGLVLVTDISLLKKDGVPMMSMMDQQDNSCRHLYCSCGKAIPDKDTRLPVISAREIEVLRCLALGHSSKQIAYELNVAVKTVDNHRQNLLKKTNCRSSGELVAFAINNGYL